MTSGWGGYAGAPKQNPFAEQEVKFESNVGGGQAGAWDIPLRDTDDQVNIPVAWLLRRV
jgi:hypothetical protein